METDPAEHEAQIEDPNEEGSEEPAEEREPEIGEQSAGTPEAPTGP